MSRQQRRAHARIVQKLGTLEQHFDRVLRDVRADFERIGGIPAGFQCISDTEIFQIPGTWEPDERGAACAALRDSFRRRGVNRYLFVGEAWSSNKPGVRPRDDPNRGECIQVAAVERGARKLAMAEVTHNEETAKLGPWERYENMQSWVLELLEEGYSDRAVKAEPAPLPELSTQDLMELPEDLRDDFHGGAEIHTQLDDLLEAEQAHSDPMSMFLALESVFRGIVKGMGSPKGLGQFARVLRDHPDHYPMFPTIQEQIPSTEHMLPCMERLQRFVDEKKREVKDNAIFGGFFNVYLALGSQVIGALKLAHRIEEWIPERREMLQQGGLRSTFELDNTEGRVFAALSAAHYPAVIVGRSNAADELFITGVRFSHQPDFATAVEDIKQHGPDLILGSEAKELFGKMEKLGLVPRGDPMKNDEEIWQLEDWAENEWAEQGAAELTFAIAMDVQHELDANQHDGNVAGYRVRRAPVGLVLVPADNDDDVYVGVQVDAAARGGRIRGWLRGSEGKVPQYYRNGRWIIPLEALHDMEDLPGKERLQAMPPFQEDFKCKTEVNQNAYK